MSQPPFKVSLVNFVIAIALGLLLILLWQLRSLIVVLMIAVVIAATLAPIIQAAHKLGIPRWLSVLLVYLSLIATLSGVGVIIGPTVVEQIQRLVRKLPVYLETLRALLEELALRMSMGEAENASFISQFFDIQGVTGWVIRSSQELAIRSFDVTKGFIGGVFGSLLALLLSGYMLSGSDQLLRDIINLFPTPWNERLFAQVQPVSQRMGGYIQGRILVSSILAIAISIGLKFLGLSELALGLGVIAGFTNLIPFFGPVIGAIPALIVAIAQSNLTFFGVLLLFVIIQNIETYLLDPLLVGTSVKVPPLYQLLAVLGGAQLLGIIGALIVPPWVAGSAVLLENLYVKPKLQAEKKIEIEA